MSKTGNWEPREPEMSLMETIFIDAVEDTKEHDGVYADDDDDDLEGE
jgi:hypothetical protein